jgi:NADPH:quinone reductase
MKAVQLCGYEGIKSLKVVEVEKPQPGPTEVLIEVKAAGINFAELELTRGKYPVSRMPPFVMGFEAAGIVAERGSEVQNLKIGDRVTSIVSSGGYAEYAIADAELAIQIPTNISFPEASTITVQGLSAYALLKLAARPQPGESILVQAAAGGVGLYLVQLAKLMGVNTVIALAGSKEKTDLVKMLGADVVVNYSEPDWTEQVVAATEGKGVDVVLEAASGEVGAQSFKLLALFGRMVIFGARNIHDTLGPGQLRQLIQGNQTIVGFNIPTVPPSMLAECLPALLELIEQGKLKLFAGNSFPLADVHAAFRALSDRQTIGKVVLTP